MAKAAVKKAQSKDDGSQKPSDTTPAPTTGDGGSSGAPPVKGVRKPKATAPRRRKRELADAAKKTVPELNASKPVPLKTKKASSDASKDTTPMDTEDTAPPVPSKVSPAVDTEADASEDDIPVYSGSMDLCADGVLLWEQYAHALSPSSKLMTLDEWEIAPTSDLSPSNIFVKRYGLLILNPDASYEWSVTTQYPMQGAIRAQDQTRGKTFVCIDQPRLSAQRLIVGGSHDDALQLFAGTRALRVDNTSTHGLHRHTLPMYVWKIREDGEKAPPTEVPTELDVVESHSRVELQAGVFFGDVGHCATFDGHHVSDSITAGNFAVVSVPLETIVRLIAAGFREQQDTGPGIPGVPMSPFLDCAQRIIFQSNAGKDAKTGKRKTCMALCEPILYRVTVYAASTELFCTAYTYAPSPALAGMFVTLGLKQIASQAIKSVMPVTTDVSMERTTGCERGFLFAPGLNLGVIANAAESVGLKAAFDFERTQASYAAQTQRPIYNVPDPMEVTWFNGIEI